MPKPFPKVMVWRNGPAKKRETGDPATVNAGSAKQDRLAPIVEQLFSITAEALPQFSAPDVIVLSRAVGDPGSFDVESLDEETTESLLKLLSNLRKGGQA